MLSVEMRGNDRLLHGTMHGRGERSGTGDCWRRPLARTQRGTQHHKLMKVASRKLKLEIAMSTDFALCRKSCGRDANRGFTKRKRLPRAVVSHMNCSVE